MITIDGIRYVSAKTYSQLTGLSQSSISNKKADLPFRHFDEINMDLLNFDLLELSEEVRRSAEQRLATRETLPTYTASQLGEYFIALITRLTNQASTADQLRLEAETALLAAQNELSVSQDKIRILEDEIHKALLNVENTKRKLQDDTQEFNEKLDTTSKQILALTEENKTLFEDKNGLTLAIKTLESIMSRVANTNEKAIPGSKTSNTKKSHEQKHKTN